MSPQKRIHLKSAILATILFGLMAIFQSKHFFANKNLIDDFAKESLITYEKLLSRQFSGLEKVINHYQNGYTQLNSFSSDEHDEIAKKLLFHFDYVLAFNYINSDYVIEHVYPIEANQKALGKSLKNHDDILIREFIGKGLSRTQMTLLPPIRIYQGGEAIIFYYPVHFKNGDFGWINIVVKTDFLFSELIDDNYTYKSNFGLYHKDSSRFYFKTGNFSEEDYWYKLPIKIINQDAILFVDLKKQMTELKNELIIQSLIVSVFIMLFVFLFAQFLKQKEDIFSKYVDIYNEGNLLRILIHDLGSPLMSLQMSLEEISSDKPSSNIKIIKKSAQTISNIHAMIRQMLISRVDLKAIYHSNIGVIINDLLEQNKDLLNKNMIKANLNIIDSELEHAISSDILRNHVINNLMINSLKYAKSNSSLNLIFNGHTFVIENEAELIEEEMIARLNSYLPEDAEEMKKQAKGMGVGLFIAKIFCRQYKVGFRIEQDHKNQLFRVILTF